MNAIPLLVIVGFYKHHTLVVVVVAR